jgi:hypothetical protein
MGLTGGTGAPGEGSVATGQFGFTKLAQALRARRSKKPLPPELQARLDAIAGRTLGAMSGSTGSAPVGTTGRGY